MSQFVVVLTSIVGVAMVAVIVSKNAQTPQVIGSFWQGFSGALTAATGPVNGSSSTNLGSTLSNAFSGISTGGALSAF